MKSTPFGQFLMINICSKCIPIFQKNIYHDYLSMYHDINMILSYCSALLFIQHMSGCTEWVLFRHEGVFFFSFFLCLGPYFISQCSSFSLLKSSHLHLFNVLLSRQPFLNTKQSNVSRSFLTVFILSLSILFLTVSLSFLSVSFTFFCLIPASNRGNVF